MQWKTGTPCSHYIYIYRIIARLESRLAPRLPAPFLGDVAIVLLWDITAWVLIQHPFATCTMNVPSALAAFQVPVWVLFLKGTSPVHPLPASKLQTLHSGQQIRADCVLLPQKLQKHNYTQSQSKLWQAAWENYWHARTHKCKLHKAWKEAVVQLCSWVFPKAAGGPCVKSGYESAFLLVVEVYQSERKPIIDSKQWHDISISWIQSWSDCTEWQSTFVCLCVVQLWFLK